MIDAQQAATDAYAQMLREVLTKPLSASALAEWFGVNRDTMKSMLAVMHGAEQCGTFWRVPLFKMPPDYLMAEGLLSKSADICPDLPGFAKPVFQSSGDLRQGSYGG